MILTLFSGAWGKTIHEKNLKQKSRDTVPLTKTYKFVTDVIELQNLDAVEWKHFYINKYGRVAHTAFFKLQGNLLLHTTII
jgi:hypothetical protein